MSLSRCTVVKTPLEKLTWYNYYRFENIQDLMCCVGGSLQWLCTFGWSFFSSVNWAFVRFHRPSVHPSVVHQLSICLKNRPSGHCFWRPTLGYQKQVPTGSVPQASCPLSTIHFLFTTTISRIHFKFGGDMPWLGLYGVCSNGHGPVFLDFKRYFVHFWAKSSKIFSKTAWPIVISLSYQGTCKRRNVPPERLVPRYGSSFYH